MRYFFHFKSADAAYTDSEGDELASLDAAREEARLSARELMSLDHGEPDSRFEGAVYEITDADGVVLAVTEFTEPLLGEPARHGS